MSRTALQAGILPRMRRGVPGRRVVQDVLPATYM